MTGESMEQWGDPSDNSDGSPLRSSRRRERRERRERLGQIEKPSSHSTRPIDDPDSSDSQLPLRSISQSSLIKRASTRSRRSRAGEDSSDSHSFAGDNEGGDRSDRSDRRLGLMSAVERRSGRALLEHLSVDGMRDSKGLRGWIRKLRLACGKIVEEPRVQLGIIILIVINAILMGIATFDFVTDVKKVDDAFAIADRVFLVIFTVEMGLQMFYRSLVFFMDPWLVFDFIVVVTSWSLESLQIVRAFRIFRAFRLVTRIGPLRELVMAIGAVMPRMYAIAMLLFLIFYIFSVLFTELFGELVLSENYFGSLDASLFTSMEMMTLEWADVARQVMDQKPWAWAPILAFISVSGFIVFNLIVAVVCDAVSVVDREVQAEKHPEILSDKEQLQEAQERIWELTEAIEILMMRQERLLSVVGTLSKEVSASVDSRKASPPKRIPLDSCLKSSRPEGQQESLEKSETEVSGDQGKAPSDVVSQHRTANEPFGIGSTVKPETKVDSFQSDLEADVRQAVDRITLGRGSTHAPAQESAGQTAD